MLVLSRREDQKVLFPNLGITVEILGIRGRNVRLGIDAPPQIRVIRNELAAQTTDEMDCNSGQPEKTTAEQEERHWLNNQLNSIGLELQIAAKRISKGEAETALRHIEDSLRRLRDLENEQAQRRNATDQQLALGDSNQPKRARALLVEDNDNERQLLSTVLELSGIQAETVANGEEAIDYLRNNPKPDFVLIDMQMPKLNGPQTISIIRQQLQIEDLPIYGVSGLERSEVNIPLGEEGVSGWFSKPVQADEMIRQIFAEVEDAHITTSLN